jgi:malate dehydrogenase (oxaloacetate-decarboxylating)(NADP+)
LRPGQGNNAYVFPGIGLGAIACQSRAITDAMLLSAAHTLASWVDEADLASGTVYPPLTRIRDVSLDIATAIAELAWQQGLAQAERPADIRQYIRAMMYEPDY